MNPLAISLIISFYNKIDLLKRVLESVERQSFRAFEVIIADDGSCPEVVEELQQLAQAVNFPLKHIWQEDKGWRKNAILNKAVKAAQADYLVFIDGDCLLDPRFLQEHFDARHRGQVVTGRRVLLSPSASERLLKEPLRSNSLGMRLFFQLLWDTLVHRQETQLEQMIHLPAWIRRCFIKERKRYVLGCNFSLFKDDLMRVNGFDERFQYPGYGEDIDLEHRLARLGVEAWSRKGQLIQYHFYHKHFDTNYAPNQQLLNDNNRLGVTFTPYGIH